MKKNKRGQATILTTILLVLIAIVGIVIVFNIVKPLVSEKSGEIEKGVEKLSLPLLNAEIKSINFEESVDGQDNNVLSAGSVEGVIYSVDVDLNAGAGKGTITEVLFIFETIGEDCFVNKNVNIKPLETKTFNILTKDCEEIKTIKNIEIIDWKIKDKEGAETLVETNCTDTCTSLGFECENQIICNKTIYCGNCSVGYDCISGNCVEIEIFNATISLATLKDIYSIGEQINLTDPPNEEVSEENKITGKIIENRANLEQPIKENRLNFKGYIIQFEDAPILEEENKLNKKAKKNEGFIEKHPIISAISTYKFWALTPEKVSDKIKDYSENLEKENKKIKERIISNVKNKRMELTEEVISKEKEIKIMNEFKKVFNGISLDVSEKEAENLEKIIGVKKIYPNLIVNATLMDSIPVINADDVWQMQDDYGFDITGKNISIAILDTGIDYTHSDLGNCTTEEFLSGVCQKVVGGYNFVDCEEWDFFGCISPKNPNSNPMDDNGHGTHCAGISAGSGNGRLRGIAPDAKLYGYKVLNSHGSGLTDWILAGLENASEQGVDILSMSLGINCGGYYDEYCGPNDIYGQTIDNIVDSGIIVVIAAGNSGAGLKTIGSPGTARKAITVGATFKKDYENFYLNCTPDEWTDCGRCESDGRVLCNYWGKNNPEVDKITPFSSRGPVYPLHENNQFLDEGIMKPDVLAPGAIICSARYDNIYPEGEHIYYYPCLDEKHVQVAGTSMSTPMVAGAVALLKQKNPNWAPNDIKNTLKSSSIDLEYSNKEQGAGRVDILSAINLQFPLDIPDFGIVMPLDKQNIYNMPIQIKGIFPEDYSSLSVEYSLVLEDDWSSNGITIIGQDNIIAEFDPSVLTKVGLYEFKVFIERGGYNDSDFVYFYMDKNLKENFPLFPIIFGWWNSYSPVMVEDINGDNEKEIILGGNVEFQTQMGEQVYVSQRLKIYILKNNGDTLAWKNWRTDEEFTGTLNSISIGDLNNNSEKEIIVSASRYTSSDDPSLDGGLYVFDSSLNLIWKKLNGYGEFMRSSIGDLDNDGENEIIIPIGIHSQYGNENNEKLMLYSFNYNGAELFSKVIGPYVEGDRGVSLGDVNGDGYKEIIISTFNENYNDVLYIFDYNGNEIYSLNLDNIFVNNSNLEGEIILADITNDNVLEIIFVLTPKYSGGYSSLIYLSYNEEGYEKNIIPLDFRAKGVILSDLDNNGISEFILIGSESGGQCESKKNIVAIIDFEGNIILKKDIIGTAGIGTKGISFPITGDLDGDNKLEIIFSANDCDAYEENSYKREKVFALDFNGEIIEDFPKLMLSSEESLSLISEDFDNNGKIDIIGFGGFPESLFPNYEIYYWEMETPYDELRGGWSRFQYDSQHTGCYQCDVYKNISEVNKCSELSNEVKLKINELQDSNEIVVLKEGGKVNIREFLVISTPAGGRVLELRRIEENKITFRDAISGEDYELYIDNYGDSILRMDGYTFNVKSYISEGYIEITWFPEDEINIFYNCGIEESRPQSKIVNNENFDLTGQLTMILQKKVKVNKNWIDEQIVVDKSVVVPTNSLLKLDNEWNPQNVITNETGKYRVYARFETSNDYIETDWEFEVV